MKTSRVREKVGGETGVRKGLASGLARGLVPPVGLKFFQGQGMGVGHLSP